MAEKNGGKPNQPSGVIPPVVAPQNVPQNNRASDGPNSFSQFAPDALKGVVIENPSTGQVVTPGAGPHAAPTVSGTVELPNSLSPAVAAMIQAAVANAVRNMQQSPGQGQTPNPVYPTTANDAPRMWNPMQPFTPTARLSDIEATAPNADMNPNQIIPNAPINKALKPKDGCPPVLIDAYTLLTRILAGRWLLPGCPLSAEAQTTVTRLRSEIEQV